MLFRSGKKITWRDGLSALRCIVQYNLFGRKAKPWTPPDVALWDTDERLASISVDREQPSALEAGED